MQATMTDAEWRLIARRLPPRRRLERPRKVDLSNVVQAILFIVSTECQWRALNAGSACDARALSLSLRLQSEHLYELADEFGRVHLVTFELKSPGHDLGNIKQSIDQSGKVFGATAYDLDCVNAAPAGKSGSRSMICE
jgi:Putative transposase of IS4/5 family (DUF4096)